MTFYVTYRIVPCSIAAVMLFGIVVLAGRCYRRDGDVVGTVVTGVVSGTVAAMLSMWLWLSVTGPSYMF